MATPWIPNDVIKYPTLVRLLIVLLTAPFRTLDSKTFNLGVLLPYTGHWPYGRTLSGAVGYAVDTVNNDPSFTALRDGGHYFNFTWKDTRCEEGKGLKALVELWAHSQPIDAFIGPGCDCVCQSAGRLAGEWGLPMISYGCASDELSNKDQYPTFARTLAPYSHSSTFVASIMRHFNWKKICIITTSEDVWHVTAEQLQLDLTASGFHAGNVQLYTSTGTKDSCKTAKTHQRMLREAKEEYRVFLLSIGTSETRDFMLHASKLGMLNGQYVFLTVHTMLSARYGANTLQGDDGKDDVSVQAFEGILDVTSWSPTDSDSFDDVIRQYAAKPPFNDPIPASQQIESRAHLLYDAIFLYALAVNKSLAEGVDPDNATAISANLFNRSFTAFHGQVFVDEHGDGIMSYALRNIQNGSFVNVMTFDPFSEQLLVHNSSIRWPGGGTHTIPDHPKCGWDNEHCKYDVGLVVGVTISVAVLIIIFIPALVRVYRKRKAALELASNEWRIAYTDLQMDGLFGSKAYFGSRMSRHTLMTLSTRNMSELSDDLRGSFASRSMLGDLSNVADLQVFTKLGYYNGQVVAVKTIRKPYIYLTKAITQELNEVRSLRHPNINQFLGACVEANHISVVSSYCSKGSIQDVLENDNIKLDRIFKLSFASDIAQGMAYLHSSDITFHGRLKSSNVLIDSRWTCKVADAGLRNFREGERGATAGEHAYYYQLLWTAPEHLRQDESCRTGSQKGDVYAFGIILQEIVMRTGPFGSVSEEPKEIIDRVQKGEHPVYRPKVFLEDADEELLDLMRLCWEEIFFFRPNFTTIKDSLKKMNQGRQSNLVDQMMHMMEKYADHLEDLVEERTKQLAEEQKKTDELLGRMLPSSVAEQLKIGKTIQPETYVSVTVFFSDVVGFTSMAAASTPLQVVDFLNDLYTCFDNILEHYDVYKVETIGDAYMVGSGLPVRNGNRHAGEICTMALDLLSAVKSFSIRHAPDRQLQLRIGIHTGPVVAGVVGLKMPRYCLFGDTVNYASRMESSGLALRIHVSPECKTVLDQLGGYHLVKRGLVKMKGKGAVNTYYLTGKDGFSKPLPDLSLAASIEEHEFK